MKVIHTPLDLENLSTSDKDCIYNGMDSLVTLQLHEMFEKKHNEFSSQTYTWSLAQRNLTLSMQVKGILVEQERYHTLVASLKKREERVRRRLKMLARSIEPSVADFNPNSPNQIEQVLHMKGMRLERIFLPTKGVLKYSVNREALEILADKYPYARAFIKGILLYRDITKKLGALASYVDETSWRFYSSYAIAGTESGRYSSSRSPFNKGASAQTITDELRSIFVADPGYIFCYIDLEQAESRAVAYLANDPSYILACESGDLHTTVCKMNWRDKHWTGNLKEDRAIAEEKFYRIYSYRDMAKRLGHGTNYYGQPHSMSRHTKVSQHIIADFQTRYFSAFPGIKNWHSSVAYRLQTEGALTTPFNRYRNFFNRHNDDATLREAIAYEPQSTVADYLNIGAYKVFKHFADKPARIMAQIHDAILFMVPIETAEEDVAKARQLMQIEVKIKDKTMVIPTGEEWGYRWDHSSMRKTFSAAVKETSPPNYADFNILDLIA